MPNLFRLLSDAIAGLPDWQQNVIATLIAASLLGLYPTLKAVSAARRRRQALSHQLAEAAAAKELARKAEFESFDAELGEQDHADNFLKTPYVCMELLKRSVDLITELKTSIQRTPGAFPAKSAPDYVQRKREITSNAARDEWHPRVSELEHLAAEFSANVELFQESYLAMKAIVRTDADRKQWEMMSGTLAGKFADAFLAASQACEVQRHVLQPLYGKSQDLNRIVVRFQSAMASLRDSSNRMHTFCHDNRPTIADASTRA
jgi:hypothetical protein